MSLPETTGAGKKRHLHEHPRTVMFDRSEANALVKSFSDSSRQAVLHGRKALIPLKYDSKKEPLTQETFDARKHLKRLSMDDLRFLKAWRDNDWNAEKACEKAGLEFKKAEKIVRRLQVFREEDAITRTLSNIPTPAWVATKHVENVYGGGTLNDSEHKSLAELAKIGGAYKSTAQINIQQNVWNLPTLTPEIEAKFKALAEEALEAEVMEDKVA